MAADQSNQQIIDADCISATRPCFKAHSKHDQSGPFRKDLEHTAKIPLNGLIQFDLAARIPVDSRLTS
jgi:hypothetical protein